MSYVRAVTHKARKPRMSSDDILRRRLSLFKAIPVYPEEITGKDLGKKMGFSIDTMIIRLSSDALVCEDDGRYCWPSERDKRKTIFEFINMASVD